METTEILYSMLLAAFAAIVWILKWIYDHNKRCHTKPIVDIELLKLGMVQVKEHCERNSKNIHDLRDEFSPAAVYFQMIGEGKIKVPMRASNPPHKQNCPHYADSLAPCTCGADSES